MDKKSKCKKSWIIVSVILFLVLIASIFTNGFGLKSKLLGKSETQIGNEMLKFVNNNLLQSGTTASLAGASCDSSVDLCNVEFDVNGQSIKSYVSSDGKIFFPDSIKVEEFQGEQSDSQQSSGAENVKPAEKAKANLFIMSYCPYGLQSQKAMLPVMDLLKEEAEIDINFVNYAMHDKKEIDENLLQYCLQDKDYDKYVDYLNCFVKDGESTKCLESVGVNQEQLNTCIENTDKEYKVTQKYNNKETWVNGTYPSFPIEDDLNQKYQVQGSPTLVINGSKVSPARNPEAYKNAICKGFNNPPEDCEETLSSKSPQPSFGVGESDSSTNASCN